MASIETALTSLKNAILRISAYLFENQGGFFSTKTISGLFLVQEATPKNLMDPFSSGETRPKGGFASNYKEIGVFAERSASTKNVSCV